MKAGFAGLGAMGWHMAAHLADKKLLGAVWNRTAATAEKFSAEYKVPAVTTPVELWAHCDVVILCVSADAQVLAMVDALATSAAHGKLVIDDSTVSADTAREAAARLQKVGARFLDAPVSGGTEGAKHARLVFMVGGDEADVTTAQPLFDAMGARTVHLGSHGSGQSTKAVNQVMNAGIEQAVTEGMAFAEAMGLPLDKVVDVVGSGAAGSWFVNHRGKTMVRGEFAPGFKVALHHKDLLICQQMVRALGGKLPVTEATIPQYEELMRQGYGDEDVSALYRLNKNLFPSKS